MTITIKRQDDSSSKPYWESFLMDTDPNWTIADLLDELNYRDDLFNAQDKQVRRIRWSCECHQKMCGACAMIINGRPSLACNTFLRDIKGDELKLEPLSKFPVQCDLVVDRSIIHENLKKAGLYIGTYAGSVKKSHQQQYDIAKCLKCGLCLEACPNYVKGKDFFGAIMANDSYLMYTSSEDRKKELKKEYRKHFSSGCSKSLACMEVCPMKIETISSIAKMK